MQKMEVNKCWIEKQKSYWDYQSNKNKAKRGGRNKKHKKHKNNKKEQNNINPTSWWYVDPFDLKICLIRQKGFMKGK